MSHSDDLLALTHAITGGTLFIGDVGRPDLLASVGVAADQPEAPDNFVHDVILNRQERASLGTAMAQTLKPLSLAQVLALEPSGAQLLDVRDGIDFEGGHLKGAFNIPLAHLDDRFGEIPADRPVAVHCEGGYRSAIAASLLQKLGRRDVHDIVGGYKAWLAAKLPA